MSVILDKYGKTLPRKKAFGEFGSPYEYPNYGRYTSYNFVNQDHEQSVNMFIRDQLVKWSRMTTAQLPFLQAGVRTFSQFVAANAYLPTYSGEDSNWWDEVQDYLLQLFYPNACTRGLDFQTMMLLACDTLTIDGDFGSIYGETKDAMPQVQIIPSNRIGSLNDFQNLGNLTPNPRYDAAARQGPFPNTIITDGIVYKMDGQPIGFMVNNPNNLVLGNKASTGTTVQTSQFFSFKDAQLIYDPRFFDKGRGLPAMASGVLQALSVLELDRYITEGQKMAACTALTEETLSGEGPYEEQVAVQRLISQNNSANNISPVTPLLSGANSGQGLRVMDGPSIRYVPRGFKIQTLDNKNPSEETLQYITRFEQQILQTIGIPHEILFSRDAVSGRMSDGVCKVFNNAVAYRQSILDRYAKFVISWAVAKGVDNGYLPPNDKDENFLKVFGVTHPPEMSLNESYDRRDRLAYFNAGLLSMNDITMMRNKSAEDVIGELEKENKLFFMAAKRVADESEVPLDMVVQKFNESIKGKVAPSNSAQPVETDDNENN